MARKKKRFRAEHGRLYCQACGFDFAEVYGERGDDYIECHHVKPVVELRPGDRTRLRDLVLLCANCHRMVHAKRPWLTVGQLGRLLDRTPEAGNAGRGGAGETAATG